MDIKSAYYFFWAVFGLYNFYALLKFKTYYTKFQAVRVYLQSTKNAPEDRIYAFPNDLRKMLFGVIFEVAAIGFKLVGLITINLPIFLIWLVYEIGLAKPMQKIRDNKPERHFYFFAFFTFLDLALSVLVIYNAYVTKIGLF